MASTAGGPVIPFAAWWAALMRYAAQAAREASDSSSVYFAASSSRRESIRALASFSAALIRLLPTYRAPAVATAAPPATAARPIAFLIMVLSIISPPQIQRPGRRSDRRVAAQ